MLARAVRTLAAALAATITLSASPVHASPIALDGSWNVMFDYMLEGDYFTDTGTGSSTFAGATTFDWLSDLPVMFRITDLYVVSDAFRVYDNGVALFDVVNGSSWPSIPGCLNPYSAACHWTDVAADAWLDPVFAKGSYLFAPGDHSLVIQSLDIPVHVTGTQYVNGTVAISAEQVPVPEPASLLLLGTGLAGVAYGARRKSKPRA